MLHYKVEKKKIYILEDNADIQEILMMVFEDDGYEVKLFSSVAEFEKGGLSIIPDVFLLDVSLPDGNGLEVCCELKAGIKTAAIPVVIMTANSEMQKMKDHCNADCFISKPFDIYHLTSVISQLIL
jgi:two-component system phosphate regulon response regulator PhoB